MINDYLTDITEVFVVGFEDVLHSGSGWDDAGAVCESVIKRAVVFASLIEGQRGICGVACG